MCVGGGGRGSDFFFGGWGMGNIFHRGPYGSPRETIGPLVRTSISKETTCDFPGVGASPVPLSPSRSAHVLEFIDTARV